MTEAGPAWARRLGARRPAVAALVVTVAAVACSGEGGTARSAIDPDAARAAVAALCDMAASGEADEAARRFENDAHETLHAIGDAVREEDPALAGRLLRAKARVETHIATEASADAMRADVETLLDATVAVVRTLGIETAVCEG